MIRRGAAALVIVLAAAPAAAQVADIARASCGDFMALQRGDRGELLIWLHGYYAGSAQRPLVDRARVDEAIAAMQQACERDPALPLIGVEARAILLGEPRQPAPPPAAPPPAAPAAPQRQIPTPTR
jgi:HdeA/HdeB family